MGIRTKFLIYIILPLLIAAMATAFYTSIKNFSLLSESAKRRFILNTELVADKISSENVRGITASKSASASAEILFGNRVSSVKMIKRMLEAFPSFSGAGISYAINADFNDFRADLGLKNIRDGKDVYADGALDSYDFTVNKTLTAIDEWIAASTSGRFAAFWERIEGELVMSPIAEAELSATTSALRKRIDAGEKDVSIISEPFISNGKMIVEYVSAIMGDGRFSGQVSFESDMARIQNILSSSCVLGGEQYFVISTQDRVVASSKFENLKSVAVSDIYIDNAGNIVQGFLREEKGVLVRDESALNKADLKQYNSFYSDILHFAGELAKNSILTSELSEKKIAVFKDSKTSIRYYVDISYVRVGKWIVVHFCPEVDFISAVMSSIVGNLALVVVIFCVGLAGIFILSKFVGRVASCRNVLENLANGHLPKTQIENNANDESGRLNRALSKAMQKTSAVFARIDTLQIEVVDLLKNLIVALENYAVKTSSIDLQIKKVSGALKLVLDNHNSVVGNIERVEKSITTSADFKDFAKEEISNIDDLVNSFSRNAVSAMRRNSSIKDKLSSIAEVSAEISKVAEESNLLSLNASIEAEKSGRYGGSFSVIAREINRLSENISNSSTDMKNITRDVENAIAYDSSESDLFLENVSEFSVKYSKLVENMNSFSEQISSAVPVVEQMSKNTKIDADEINRATEIVAEIFESANALSVLREELSDCAEMINDKVRKIGEGVAELKQGE